MPDFSLRRFDDSVGLVTLGQMWRLTKGSDQLACALTTHPLGWELRAMRNEELSRSQVCKVESDVLDTAEAWKREALAHGWTEWSGDRA